MAERQEFLAGLAKAAQMVSSSQSAPEVSSSNPVSSASTDRDQDTDDGEAGAEESVEQNQVAHDEHILEHHHEPRDPTWAPGAESAFHRGVAAIAGFPGKTVAVDCRTTLCTVELEWPDFRTATSSHGAVVLAPYEQNCASEILLTPPNDPSLPYRATALFRCSERSKR